ncbi:MAG: M3 family oligoendopeptidase [Cellulosilyticum sp.]|nr:M3 family oligoendopeptidase [Cellulosilyticum sp.]
MKVSESNIDRTEAGTSKKESSLDWSLDELYDSFEGNAYQDDLKKLDTLIKELVQVADEITKDHENEKEKLERYINLSETMSLTFEKLGVYAELIVSVNSKDELANKYADIIDQKQSELAEPETKISKWISEIKDLETIIDSSARLQEFKFFFKEIVKNSKYLLSEKEEVIIAKMKNTGSTAWVNYKNLLISTHKVELEQEGVKEELPLTVVLNMAYDKDREVRKKAYEAEIESYKKIEEGIVAALNGIKGEVLTVSKLRGYKSPLDMTLKDSRMQKKTLDAMLEAMKESMPIFRKYLRRKAEMLGYSNGLPFYEMYAPVIEKEMKYTYEEGKAFVEKQFRSFDNELGDYARKAMDNNWIDVLPKEGKVGGAFCCAVHSIGESRVLLNYGDNFGDTITMAHELGHGYHGECLKNESILNTNYPMPLAETASTFCETIVKKAAIKEGTKEEAFAILETEISDATQVIVDIYSRYLFETAVFEQREESPITVEQAKNFMIEAQKEAYGDGLDPEYLHPYMWTWKSHYYYADANFYNFPYAFGLLFAKGLYAQYLKDTETFPGKYKQLLAVTGKMDIEDVTKTIGIDVSNPEFWRDSLKIIEEDIEEFMKLSYEI